METPLPKKRQRNFHCKVDTIVLAEAMAAAEGERLGEGQYGAGRIVDVAVLEYARKRYSPDEIAALVSERGGG